MIKTFGDKISKVIPTISVEKLVEKEYKKFVNIVVQYGKKTYDFIRNDENIKNEISKFEKEITMHEPNLSVEHISALCDFIFKDTIVEIKCTNSITEKHVRQVLAYHYLSKFRTDVDIKHVIVYDAVSGKHIKISLNH